MYELDFRKGWLPDYGGEKKRRDGYMNGKPNTCFRLNDGEDEYDVGAKAQG